MENLVNSSEVFTIDLTSALSPADMVFELSQVLDNENAFSKNIHLKLAKMDLSDAQLLSLKSLISSINSNLCCIDCDSEITKQSAKLIGIKTGDEYHNETENVTTNYGQETQEEPTVSYQNNDTNYEQELDDFAPHTEDVEEEKWEIVEGIEDDESEDDESDNADNNSETFENNEETLNTEEQPETTQEEVSDNFLQDITPSIEFDELNKNTNVQSHVVQKALNGIFENGQKFENIIDKDKQETEETTIELNQPLDDVCTKEDVEIKNMSVKYVKQTIRSGNVVTSDGNLVIIGDCHPGSEIHAAGDITVWGLLGGIAHAGNKGNTKAKVRALQFNPVQLRIANLYSRRPDSLHTICVDRTDTFTPEEARIFENEIIIYKMNEK